MVVQFAGSLQNACELGTKCIIPEAGVGVADGAGEGVGVGDGGGLGDLAESSLQPIAKNATSRKIPRL